MKVTLAEIATIVGGSTPSTKDKENYLNGTISWITPRDLSRNASKYIFSGERWITEKGFSSCGVKMLPKDTVLLTTRAPVGYVALAGTEVCTNQGFKNLVCNTKYVDPEYLYYYLSSSREKLASRANGSTFKELSTKDVRALQLDIPPLTTQKTMVELLSRIDRVLSACSQAIRHLEDYLALVYRKYNYDHAKSLTRANLGSVANLVSGGTPSTRNEEYWRPGDVHWYTPGEIARYENVYSLGAEVCISNLGLSRSSAKLVPPYSVLMTSRATIGKLAINIEPCTTNQGVTSFIPIPAIGYQQLYLCLREKAALIGSKGNGSTFKEVYKPELRQIELLYDSTGELNGIINPYFAAIEEMAKTIQSLLCLRERELTRLFHDSYIG